MQARLVCCEEIEEITETRIVERRTVRRKIQESVVCITLLEDASEMLHEQFALNEWMEWGKHPLTWKKSRETTIVRHIDGTEVGTLTEVRNNQGQYQVQRKVRPPFKAYCLTVIQCAKYIQINSFSRQDRESDIVLPTNIHLWVPETMGWCCTVSEGVVGNFLRGIQILEDCMWTIHHDFDQKNGSGYLRDCCEVCKCIRMDGKEVMQLARLGRQYLLNHLIGIE